MDLLDRRRHVEDALQRHRLRLRISARAVVSALLAALGGSILAATAQAGFPSLYVTYVTESCTFKLTNDSGAAVASVPPGTYQFVITTSDPYGVFDQSGRHDLYACKGFVQFRLSGPGVSVATTLDYGDASSELYSATLQAGATYTLQDDNNIAGTRRSISVATSGSSVLTPSTSVSSGATAVLSLRGNVSRSGKLSLRRNGKVVTSLKAGRYAFSVDDQSTTSGFRIQATNGNAVTITTAGYIGWQEATLTLHAGRWSFFTPGGAKTVFLVVA